MTWASSRVVVTGGAGFLGSHLVDRFLADGAEVIGVDRDPAMIAEARRRREKVAGEPVVGMDVGRDGVTLTGGHGKVSRIENRESVMPSPQAARPIAIPAPLANTNGDSVSAVTDECVAAPRRVTTH